MTELSAALATQWTAHPTVQAGSTGATIRGDAATIAARPEEAARELPQLEAGSGGDLELRELLGEGGMGQVFLAEQRSVGRTVAVKRTRALSDDAGEAALIREGLVTGALEHPNVVPVHAIGRDRSGRALLVMKRIEGTTLASLLEAPDHPAWADLLEGGTDRMSALLEVLVQVCHALELAHERGFIHRDVKAENVMIGAFGTVYLLDWGLATRVPREPGPADLAGTPCYMAPEMVDGRPERLDSRTDVYLLGALLHHVLVGRPRHDGASVLEVLLAAERSEPFRYGDEVPRELAELCNRATHRDPAMRPPSVAGFRRALREFLRHSASFSLASAASESLSAATRLALDAPDTARLLSEARFGFGLALREWAGNEAAARGRDRVLELSIERELALKSPAAARALAAERGPLDAALEQRIAEVARELAERERLARGVDVLRREMDVSPAARWFAAVAGFMLFLGLTLTLVSWRSGTLYDFTLRDILAGNVTILVVASTSLVLLRNRLLRTALARRVGAAIVTQVAGACLLLWLLDVAGVADPLLGNALALGMLAGTFAVIAIMSLPPLGLCAAICAIGALSMVYLAPYAALISSLTNALLIFTIVWLFLSGRVRPRAGDVLA